jgi:pyruvate/2-oxoglutarate dehydrogenase complex dihydrolipoamide dehydrogenase (E3) component
MNLDEASGAEQRGSGFSFSAPLASSLLAVGRRPNTDDLGLEAAGVATDERGYIQVAEQLRTNVLCIWAIGDCNAAAPSPTLPTMTTRSSLPISSTARTGG